MKDLPRFSCPDASYSPSIQLRPLRAASHPMVQAGKHQILAKKGFLTAKNITSELVLLIYSERYQVGVLLQLSGSADGFSAKGKSAQDFTDSALSMVVFEFEQLGVPRRELFVYLIGGSSPAARDQDLQASARRSLLKHGLPLSSTDVGGHQTRSVWMDVATGRTIIRYHRTAEQSVSGPSSISMAS